MAVEHGAEYRGTTALVVGAGSSGIASARFLLSRGARVVLTDAQPAERLAERLGPLAADAPEGALVLELGGHRRASFGVCDLVVLSPGVPAALPELAAALEAGIPIVAEVELAARHLRGTILGITGSNGKTTTTTLLAAILQAAGLPARAAGNIGPPLVGFVEQSRAEDLYVTELSSFQLETIATLRPRVAALLNLTPDHLDRYPDFDAYAAAKRRIFMNQTRADYAVLNADDARTAALAEEVPSTPVFFSRAAPVARGAFVREDRIVYRDDAGERELLRREEIRLRGAHNLENVLAAAAMAVLAGAPAEALRRAIAEFRGVEHRLEPVATIDGVEYVNDSKATNVDAAIKSLEAFPRGIHLILGGRDKGGDFTLLRPLAGTRVRAAVLIGEAAAKIEAALAGVVALERAATLEEAVERCRRRARAGDVVLLAPACASFDMFRDYTHRGRVFKEAVRALAGRAAVTPEHSNGL